MVRWLSILVTAMALTAATIASAASIGAPPLVLAAASLQESMTAAADAWARQGHPRPVISFAASSALARQVAAGAPADLFVSADEAWMDDLAQHGLIVPSTRVSFLHNRLVVVAPVASRARVSIGDRSALARLLAAGPLAMADTEVVPAGRYGRAALEKLGVWDAVSPHVVRAENVRSALALVERGAAPFGIVYATDARASKAVRVVAVFPAASHPPISYPIARLKASTNPEGERFRRFLVSPAGRALFARFGFGVR
ncbi:MAG: molybdate ABC transporter substrate-binding protein [Sphingomonas sp. 28-66-16]|nr:MAG: molybdate ABC transporter substrate-binding protein [Sphingomonas sp. 28-66-16]